MASRRDYLKKGAIGGGVVFGGLVAIGAISEETDLIDAPDDPSDNDDGTEVQEGDDVEDSSRESKDNSEAESTGDSEIIFDDTTFDETKISFEANIGDEVRAEIVNERGVAAMFTLVPLEVEEGDPDDDRYVDHDENENRVYESESFEWELRHSGIFIFQLMASEEASATVEVTRYG